MNYNEILENVVTVAKYTFSSGGIGIIIWKIIKIIYAYKLRQTPLEKTEEYYENGTLKKSIEKFRS